MYQKAVSYLDKSTKQAQILRDSKDTLTNACTDMMCRTRRSSTIWHVHANPAYVLNEVNCERNELLSKLHATALSWNIFILLFSISLSYLWERKTLMHMQMGRIPVMKIISKISTFKTVGTPCTPRVF